MGKSIEFNGMNRHFVSPIDNAFDGTFDQVRMWGYSNGITTFTKWELTPDEIMEIAKTGHVWLAVRCGKRPMQPHWLGSERFIRYMFTDQGGLWDRVRRKLLPKPKPSGDPEPA